MADLSFGADTIVESLARFVGETVTIFTTSGGLSGSGFTGILAAVDCDFVKLITHIAAPPACPLGSSCTGPIGGYGVGGYGGRGCGPIANPLGSVTVIPVDRIASFTHNAI